MSRFLKKVFNSFIRDDNDIEYEEFISKIRESINIDKTKKEAEKLFESYKKKRREEDVKESFEELESKFLGTVKDLIESKEVQFLESHINDHFIKELFDKYTDYNYKDDKFNISIKENKEVVDFVYFKKWWKPKFSESVPISQYIISTSNGINYNINDNIIDEFKESDVYIINNKDFYSNINNDVEYFPPNSSVLNESAIPVWLKCIDSGKISIKESENEVIIDVQGNSINGKFKLFRENKNCDFWKIIKNN